MKVDLYINKSDNNVLNKTISKISSVNCIIKGAISFIAPNIILETDEDMNEINYIYIEEFNRYYFIRDIIPMTGNRYAISCKVDVLESFKNEIKNINCILANTQLIGKDNYLPSDNWITKVKDKTDIINFPNGLSDNGEYILITAGGGE